MTTSRSLSRRSISLSALLLAAAACGGSPETSAGDAPKQGMTLDPAVACRGTSPGAAQIAVLDYINTAEPKPLRFLNAAATDSALPDDVALVVQDKGPTFYWLQDEKNQQQIREKLAGDGNWATMLVLVRENTDHGDGTHTVRVGGRYVGEPNDGVVSPEKQYQLRCQVDGTTAVWAIDSTAGSGGS